MVVRSGPVYSVIGDDLYLVGTLLFTLVFNKTLGSLTPTRAQSASFWTDYLWKWTAWNGVF